MRSILEAYQTRGAAAPPRLILLYTMKLAGIQGKGTGKLGASVYAVSGGEQIVRQYNPNVSNPSTTGQVDQRSKFKLMSQLSAAMAPFIAIRKQGLVSARNIFNSINIGNARVDDGVADINLNRVQLTKSQLGIADFTADRTSGTDIAVQLAEEVTAGLDGVVYSAFTKEADGTLAAFDSVVVKTAGSPAQFAGSLKYTAKSIVVYAYGYRANSSAAQNAYGNMSAPSAEQVAKLITTSYEVASGTSLTKTKGLTMNVGETSGASDDEEHFLVSVSASGNGSVSGGGSFTAGQTCTLRATPDAEASFVAWKRGSSSGEVLSTNATYTFEVDRNITIVGVFQGGPTPMYNIAVSASPAAYGSVSGGGSKAEGSSCTVVATPASGKVFHAWTENGQTVSTSASYTFTVERARTLVAVFDDAPSAGFSNVKLNNNAWNADQTGVQSPVSSISGNCVADGLVGVGIRQNENAPAIGTQTYPLTYDAQVSSGEAFNMTDVPLDEAGKYWLIGYNENGFGDKTITVVYPYSLTKA